MTSVNTLVSRESCKLSDSLPDLAAKINSHHQQSERFVKRCRDSFTNALSHAAAAGALLHEAKQQVPHGEWLRWVESNCHIGERQARNYMLIAKADPQIVTQAIQDKLSMCKVFARIAEARKPLTANVRLSKSATIADLVTAPASQNTLFVPLLAQSRPLRRRGD